jgi:type III pantothenate kinase
MILAIDVGNTNIVLGGVDRDKIHFIARISTNRDRTADEYTIDFKHIMEIYGVTRGDVEGAIISSVVPPLVSPLKTAAERFTGQSPLIVGPGVKTGLNIRIDDPGQLGSDMVVTAVATLAKYPLPQIVVDMGTATTISVIDKDGYFIGGQIVPGVRISHDALASHTSLLTKVSLEAPSRVIGRGTIECLQSGLIYGNASMIDGLIQRIEDELGQKATVIATGGIAQTIIPCCTRKDIVIDNDLLVKGLWIIYDKNRRAKK